MTKPSIILVVSMVLAIVLSAGSAPAEGKKGPAPEAQAVWEWITETTPYEGWGYWPGHEGLYPGQSPHGAYLKLYANSIALKALREGTFPLPCGSIVMKANYGKDQETLKALTPMYKVQGYNPEAGNWFWAKYKPDGTALASGKVDSCIQCHRAKKDHDWIFTEIEN